MQKYEQVKSSRRSIIINNFLGGISWGLGATIGVSLLLTILALVAKPLALIPIFGNFFTDIAKYIALHTSKLH